MMRRRAGGAISAAGFPPSMIMQPKTPASTQTTPIIVPLPTAKHLRVLVRRSHRPDVPAVEDRGFPRRTAPGQRGRTPRSRVARRARPPERLADPGTPRAGPRGGDPALGPVTWCGPGPARGSVGGGLGGGLRSIIVLVWRFEKAMAPSSTTRATPAMAKRAPSLSCRLMMAGRISSDTRFITLMSGLSAGPAVSLNGSPTVSPMTAALWASEPLPPSWPSSMYFLALSHAPPALRQVVGHELAGEDDRGQEGAEGEVADAEADDHRREHGEQGRGGQLAQRGGGADVDDRAVVGLASRRP